MTPIYLTHLIDAKSKMDAAMVLLKQGTAAGGDPMDAYRAQLMLGSVSAWLDTWVEKQVGLLAVEVKAAGGAA